MGLVQLLVNNNNNPVWYFNVSEQTLMLIIKFFCYLNEMFICWILNSLLALTGTQRSFAKDSISERSAKSVYLLTFDLRILDPIWDSYLMLRVKSVDVS